MEAKAREKRFPELAGHLRPLERLGAGTYAIVYRATSLRAVDSGAELAIKRFKMHHSPAARLFKEAKMLVQCSGHRNVTSVHHVLRKVDDVSFELPYFQHDSFRDNLHRFDLEHTLAYMLGLFEALAHVHSRGVVHRDLKPSNALYSFERRDCRLVDFGLAEWQRARPSAPAAKRRTPERPTILHLGRCLGNIQLGRQGATFATPQLPSKAGAAAVLPSVPRGRAGTKGFRAPEAMLGSKERSGALDVWSAGVILLTILSRTYPFFNGADDLDQLYEVALLCGARELRAAALQLELLLEFQGHDPLNPIGEDPLSWEGRLVSRSLDAIPLGHERSALISLAQRCLDVNALTRITAASALEELRTLSPAMCMKTEELVMCA